MSENLKFKRVNTVIPIDLEEMSGSVVTLNFRLRYRWEAIHAMRKWATSQAIGTHADVVEILKLYFPDNTADIDSLEEYMQVALFHSAHEKLEEINAAMDQKKSVSLPPSASSGSQVMGSRSDVPQESPESTQTKKTKSSRARRSSSKSKGKVDF